jgi:FAD/FMN-containing dehydrogenase
MWRSKKRFAKKQKIQVAQGTGASYVPPSIPQAAIAQLESQLEGSLVLPAEANYQADRQLSNPAFQEFPEIIAYCEVIGDVRACLKFAQDQTLWPVLRSGGHSSAGYSVNSEMVIDLSRMSYAVVDVQNMTARVGAGTNFGHLNATLDEYGLHVPGGSCEDVCVAGFMQGGGYGLTSRQYGMNCDCVIAVKVMLADGTLIDASNSQNPDLFWAIRGGTGNNFGVLLEITYQLYELGEIWAFAITWPIQAAAKILAELQKNFMRTGDSRLGYLLILMFDDKGTPVLMMGGTYNGIETEGKKAVGALLTTPGANLILDEPGSYLQVMRALEESVQLPILLREDKQSAYIARRLKVSEWNRLLKFFRKQSPNKLSVLVVEPYGGQINQLPKDFNAFVHRDSDMDLFLDVFWRTDAEMAPAKAFLDDFMAIVDSNYSNGESYQNYPRSSQTDYAKRFWGPNFKRLSQIKKKYDPYSFFRFDQSIK